MSIKKGLWYSYVCFVTSCLYFSFGLDINVEFGFVFLTLSTVLVWLWTRFIPTYPPFIMLCESPHGRIVSLPPEMAALRHERPFSGWGETILPCGYICIAANPEQLIQKYNKSEAQITQLYQLIKDRISIKLTS